MAPRKVRLVGDLVRGLSVNDAEAQLLFERRRAAKPLLKLLRSGMTAAKEAKKLAMEKLIVESIRVDQGPMLKRFLPRARGSASPIQKKMSHVMIVLAESEKARAPKFTITAPKKVKTPKEERQRPKKGKGVLPADDGAPRESKKSSGFLKKVFSRKTASGGA